MSIMYYLEIMNHWAGEMRMFSFEMIMEGEMTTRMASVLRVFGKWHPQTCGHTCYWCFELKVWGPGTEETGAFVELPLEEDSDRGPPNTEHTGLVTTVTWAPRFFSYFLELTICNRLNTPLPSALRGGVLLGLRGLGSLTLLSCEAPMQEASASSSNFSPYWGLCTRDSTTESEPSECRRKLSSPLELKL